MGAIIATAVAVSVCFYLLKKSREGKLNRPLPPGPRGLPILGSLPFLKNDLHVYFKELADIYGPVLSLQLGAKLCVVLSSPEAAKEALKDHDIVFANHDVPAVAFTSSYGAKDILWAPYGPYWRLVRKFTRKELLCPSTIDGLSDIRRTEIRRMLKRVKEMRGKPLNLRELVSRATMNMTTEMLWGGSDDEKGQEMKALEREFLRELDDLVGLFGVPNISDFFPALACLDLQGLVRRTRKLSARLSILLDRIIEERRRKLEAEKTRDFLQVMLELGDSPDPEARITTDDTKALLLVTKSSPLSAITFKLVSAGHAGHDKRGDGYHVDDGGVGHGRAASPPGEDEES